jgi:hypothetical protein
MFFRKLLCFSFLLISLSLSAQAPDTGIVARPPVKPVVNTLARQYQLLKSQSGNYQQFKVMSELTLDSFWNILQDSVKVMKQQIAAGQVKAGSQQNEITQLQQKVSSLEEQITKSNSDSSQVGVLGVKVGKESYVVVSFVIFALLAGLLGFVFYRYLSSAKLIEEAQRDAAESKIQTETLRHRVLEIQTQLGRELQNERNKVEELQQKLLIGKK